MTPAFSPMAPCVHPGCEQTGSGLRADGRCHYHGAREDGHGCEPFYGTSGRRGAGDARPRGQAATREGRELTRPTAAGELCPGCGSREQGPDGFCSECTAAYNPTGPACPRCGHVERNAAGDCAHCQRGRERRRYRPTGRPVGRPRIEGLCSVDGCGRPRHSKGLCRRHYDRQWRRRGAAA